MGDYDAVGFSLSYSVGLPMILRMLKMSGIPVESALRDPISGKHPWIIGGGHSFYVYENIVPAVDIIACGDGEITLPGIMSTLLKYPRGTGETYEQGTKKKILIELANKEGVYVPGLYKVEAKENLDLKGYEPLVEGIPAKVKVAHLHDWNKSYAYTKPIIPFCENTMGLGNILISFGCENSCRFCSERYSCGAYRELSLEEAERRLDEIYKWSGTVDITPSAFSSGSFSQIKRLLKNLSVKTTDKINLISQRVNNYADDPNLAEVARWVGDKTVSFGCEGSSQRMRNRFNKNITEEQILKTLEFCMKAGYQKVKLFMISNPPMETQEDRDEILVLAKKIKEIKDRLASKMRIQFSFTSMVISPFTPMQFFPVTKELLEGRNMIPTINGLKELDLDFRFGSGGVLDEIYWQHLILMADRRIWPLIKRLGLLDNFVFYGNVPGGFYEKIEGYLAELGFTWNTFFHAKEKDHVFGFDIFDVGVRRDWLWKEFEGYKAATETSRCKVECTNCGACDPETRKINKERWSIPDELVDVTTVKKITSGLTPVGKLRFKIYKDENHAGVVREYWKHNFRRAANLLGLPVLKESIGFGSDDITYYARVFGIDYVEFKLHNKISDLNKVIAGMNEHLKHVKVISGKVYDSSMTMIASCKDAVLYKTKLFYDASLIRYKIEEFKTLTPIDLTPYESMDMAQRKAFYKRWPQIAKVEVPDFAKGTIKIPVDLAVAVKGAAVTEVDGYSELYLLTKGNIIPAHMVQYILGINFKEALMIDSERMDYFYPIKDEVDFFDKVCPKCGRALVVNLIGETYQECTFCKLNGIVL
jgi:radical SAM superfamily enzyme YgiQ (UPF0313 family)